MYKPPAGIYMLYDKNELVYIGETNDIYRRISEHANGRRKPGQQIKEFDHWAYIECNDEKARKKFENFLILLYKPKYNEDLSYRYFGEGNDYKESDLHRLKAESETKTIVKRLWNLLEDGRTVKRR